MNYQFQMQIEEMPPANSVAIFWPVPPDTHFQKCLNIDLWEKNNALQHLVDQHFMQQALIEPINNDYFNSLISYQMDLSVFAFNQKHLIFKPYGALSLTDDVKNCHEQIYLNEHLNNNQSNSLQIIQSIVNFLADKFSYHHHDDELNRVPLVCTHLAGDCLDINTALMKLLLMEKIASAYYIGLYFEDKGTSALPQYHSIDDWHCWVSTQQKTNSRLKTSLIKENFEQTFDWDIAHHIKRQLKPVSEKLNPVKGIRFALSTGRDLTYHFNGQEIIISHFGAPIWLMSDGTCRQAKFTGKIVDQNICKTTLKNQNSCLLNIKKIGYNSTSMIKTQSKVETTTC